ncbi:glycoside hydrolase family 27 protein [Mucilaginibacter sp. AW1-3]
MKKLPVIFFLFLSFTSFAQKFEGLALTPPMGWNSWNTFQTNINEKLVRDIADVMVASGMKDVGYTYIVLDDGWMAKERDAGGNLVADPVKFPSGMKALADYIHAKGLKFGLYNCAGTQTCAGYPGTRGYEYQDARLYASFDIDYLKFDWCYTDGINAKEAYKTMSKALKTAGRPIIFSLCEWGGNKPWLWAKDVGHLWRTTDDIYAGWAGIKSNGTWSANSVTRIIESQDSLRKYAGPGHWNDPDMLEVGNGMKVNEDRAHFAMWCMLAAPLIAGNDLRNMSPQTHDILTNKEVIAVNQDALGIQAYKYATADSVETWIKPLKNNEIAICFLNRSANTQKITCNWKEHPVKDDLSKTFIDFTKTEYNIRDIEAGKAMGKTNQTFEATVSAHDVIMIRLRKL